LAKHLKLTIKNTQIAEAINLGGLKEKLAKKKEAAAPEAKKAPSKPSAKAKKEEVETVAKVAPTPEEAAPRARARSKSVFAETPAVKPTREAAPTVEHPLFQEIAEEAITVHEEEEPITKLGSKKTSEELRKEIFGEEAISEQQTAAEKPSAIFENNQEVVEEKTPQHIERAKETPAPKLVEEPVRYEEPKKAEPAPPKHFQPVHQDVKPRYEKLGPTGKHISDLLPPPRPKGRPEQARAQDRPQARHGHDRPEQRPHEHKPAEQRQESRQGPPKSLEEQDRAKSKIKSREFETGESLDSKKGVKTSATKEFRDVKPARRQERTFDARDRHGLRDSEEDQRWRKKRQKAARQQHEDLTIRPTSLKIRTPISIKDLASEMKLKSAELIAKLFLQGLVVTLNDILDDETTIQLLGHEFGCEITIDTSEAQRIRITDKTVREEIASSKPEELTIRAPVVAFMGHVDHGKTSLIDAIRKSNRAAGEAGAITQHIGAFRCHTPVGDIAILDTPGHEAFSAMRARGADVTDIVVLVVAGDEGIRQQTLEAIHHARSANVTIVVALNKSDKPGFNPENVYRQLADNDLLPEVWGGQILTVNCSATTGAGIKELLEMLALQAEVLEIKANPSNRARGTVLESEMHKGMGAVATVLVQNGTLRLGDSIVFEHHWGHIKTMQDEFGRNLQEAPPSTPVAITGLSGLPEAGQEFIAVKSEREAREISAERVKGFKQSSLQQKKPLTLENLVQQATPTTKKVLHLVLRADVQGSLEALRVALEKIESTKAEINVIFAGVGEVSESDIQLASTSKAVVIGFHTRIESHAEQLVKQLKVQVRQHDIIYHAIDDVKVIMKGLLDKIAQETDRGKADVKAVFKSSQVGVIAGCQVTEGTIHRNHHIRVIREGNVITKTQIASLKRVKEDVREVAKGLECGIALTKFSDLQVGDVLEAFEITYLTQEL